MTLKPSAARIHIHNTVSPVASVSPINVKSPEALDKSKFVFIPFYANVALNWPPLFPSSIYLVSVPTSYPNRTYWGWLRLWLIWWPAVYSYLLNRLPYLLMKYYSDSSVGVATFASTIAAYTQSYMVTKFSCVVQYFISWCCLSPLLFSNWCFFLLINFPYQVRQNSLVGGEVIVLVEAIHCCHESRSSDEGVSTINNIIPGHRLTTLLLRYNISQYGRFNLIGNI